MAIDDPKAAFEHQYLKEEEPSPLALTILASKLALPKAALPLEIFKKVAEKFTRPSAEERLEAMWKMLVMETEHLETTKANVDDIQEAILIAMNRDKEEFNDRKREQYVKLIGNALRSEQQVEDVAAFVQTIEQLTENDTKVLKVLNRVMNRDGDWSNPSMNSGHPLHPGTFIGRREELAIEVDKAIFGTQNDRKYSGMFNREEGFETCLRLQGFGLAAELPVTTRAIPTGEYCFRPTKRGLLLLKLIGETVHNFDKYFSSNEKLLY